MLGPLHLLGSRSLLLGLLTCLGDDGRAFLTLDGPEGLRADEAELALEPTTDDDGNAAVKGTATRKPQATNVPDGYDDWLADMQAHAASGVTKDAFRATYGKSKPEHRHYLETNNRPALDLMLAKVTPKKAAA